MKTRLLNRTGPRRVREGVKPLAHPGFHSGSSVITKWSTQGITLEFPHNLIQSEPVYYNHKLREGRYLCQVRQVYETPSRTENKIRV